MLSCQCQLPARPAPLARRSVAGLHVQSSPTTYSSTSQLSLARCQARNLKSQPRTRCQAAATEEAPTEPAAAAEGLSQHLRIKLKSFDIGLLDLSVQEIMQVANSTGANPGKGPAYLPTRLRRWCVLRSPHVNKTSREHFETRTHQRIVDIKALTADTIDALMGLDLPAGVDVEVKL